MESFDNFQYDSASSYGGIGIVDDTSSVYTANTQGHPVVDFDNLSVLDYASASVNGHGNANNRSNRVPLDEDFDGVLDDLKDEGNVALPPHACRCTAFPRHLAASA